MLALTTIRSGAVLVDGCSVCSTGEREMPKAPASAAPNPRNSPRVYLGIRDLANWWIGELRNWRIHQLTNSPTHQLRYGMNVNFVCAATALAQPRTDEP